LTTAVGSVNADLAHQREPLQDNHDNAFDPQRVWLERRQRRRSDGLRRHGAAARWRNGDDAVDIDDTTPNAKDYDALNTGQVVELTPAPQAAR
jgi:hypothetical protein